MATLVVIAYPNQNTAEEARGTVWQLEEELIIQAEEIAVISRDPDGKYHVHTTHSGFSTAGGAIWGGFWGLLFGTLFFIPFAGWAMGAGLGALFGHLRDSFVDQAFQQQVRDHLQPGTSALFMMIERVTPDKAIAALEQYGGTVIKTSLSEEDAKTLQAALQPRQLSPGPDWGSMQMILVGPQSSRLAIKEWRTGVLLTTRGSSVSPDLGDARSLRDPMLWTV